MFVKTENNEFICKAIEAAQKEREQLLGKLEELEQIKKRLADIIGFFGENRVPYAGPECGLKGFPTYQSAIECLKRVAKAAKSPN